MDGDAGAPAAAANDPPVARNGRAWAPTILFSSVADDARYTIWDIEDQAGQQGARLIAADEWDLRSSATTHLVTSHSKVHNQAKRTVKFFAAVLKGDWIVSIDW